MTVSKRTRYEVLRRDNHTCRYCGASAPDVVLTVDHVTPVALGGTDNPDNLVAACKDCNAGKASTSPDAEIVEQVSDDAIRWAEAIKAAASQMLADYEPDSQRYNWFLSAWTAWDEESSYLPSGWARSLDHWVGAGLPQAILLDCLERALNNRSVTHYNVFAYMGGIARKRVEDLQDAARNLIDASGVESHGA